MQTLSNIVGVLGFLLSLLLGIIELCKYELRMQAVNPRIIPVTIPPDRIDAGYWIDVVITNSSALPIAITKASIIVNDVELDALQSVYRYKHQLSAEDIVNFPVATLLPIPLPAYGATQLVLAIPRHPILSELICTPHDEASPESGLVKISLILLTSRGRVLLPIECSILENKPYVKYRAARERALK